MISTYAKNYWIAGRTLRRGDLDLDLATALHALHSMARHCPHECIRKRAEDTLFDCGLRDTLLLEPLTPESLPESEPVA